MKPKSSRRFLNSPQLRSFDVALTPASRPLLLAVACSLGAVLLSPFASAASFTYDANTSTAGAQDGAGAWDTSTANWLLNGAGSNVAWPNLITDTAVFGSGGTIANAAAGTVTVGTVNVGLISFAPTTTTGYTLATGTITLGTGITTTSSVNSVISAKISGTAGLAFNGVLNAQNGVTLSGANDYTGITTLSTGGRITSSNATALGSNAGATASTLGTNYTQINALSTVVVSTSTAEAFLINGEGSTASGNAPGALRLLNGISLTSLIQLGSDAQISGNFGTNNLSGNVDLGSFNAAIGNGNNAVTLNISGLVTGATGGFDISKNGGSNVVNLTNAGNTYAGTTRLASGGTVGLGDDTVLGGSTVVFAGGTVRSTNATARTIANTIGTFTSNAIFGATTTQTGTLNFTSTANTSLGTATRTFTTNVDTTIAATLTNTGGLTKAGAATLFLTNTASTRTGATTVNAGILNVANLANGGTNSSIGAAAATADLLQFGGGTLQYTGSTAQTTDRLFTLNPGGGTIEASGSVVGATLSFTGTGALGTGTGADDRTLTLTGSNAGVNTLASTLGTGTSTISLAKTGTGTWALSGDNTYTGTTSITNGTLLVNGNISTSALTTVSAGATLGGDGFVSAASISGVLSPGNSIGTLTATGDVTWNSNDAWVFELGSAASSLALAGNGESIQDLLNITGVGSDFLKGSGTAFSFDFAGTGEAGYYKLVDWEGTSGEFTNDDFVATNLGSGLTGSFTLDGETSALYLNVIPEPSIAILGSLGVLTLLRRRRSA